jgi:hypothetical protein
MRPIALRSAALGLVLAAGAGPLRGDTGKWAEADRIAGLIKQLGDNMFAKRQGASQELEAIGQNALPALRNAAAVSKDLEIRRRAQLLVQAIRQRVPQLVAKGKKDHKVGNDEFTMYELTVSNRAAYPKEWFKPSPDLPPIGLNRQASRTIVDIFDGSNVRLYGFAALKCGADLDRLRFAVRKGAPVPKQVYIVIQDRKLQRSYKSNLVEIGD